MNNYIWYSSQLRWASLSIHLFLSYVFKQEWGSLTFTQSRMLDTGPPLDPAHPSAWDGNLIHLRLRIKVPSHILTHRLPTTVRSPSGLLFKVTKNALITKKGLNSFET